MNKNFLWALISAGLVVIGLLRGELGMPGKYHFSLQEGPETFLALIIFLSGLVVLFLYRGFTGSDG